MPLLRKKTSVENCWAGGGALWAGPHRGRGLGVGGALGKISALPPSDSLTPLFAFPIPRQRLPL